MLSTEPILGVEMTEAFARDSKFSGTPKIVYSNLESIALEARAKDAPLWHRFLETEEGSVLEESYARKLAIGYLVLSGLRLQQTNSENQQLISDRMTQASKELYGEPEAGEFQWLIQTKIDEFSGYQDNPQVDQDRNQKILALLQGHLTADESSRGVDRAEQTKGREVAAKKLVEALMVQFADALAVFDEFEPDIKHAAKNYLPAFIKAVSVLGEAEPIWHTWKVNPADRATFASDARTRTIQFGMNHKPMTPLVAKGKFCHEVLVHSLRAVNGSKTSDSMMQYGMPNFLDAEEGLSVFVEYGITGEISIGRSDRYVDFGLALGSSNTTPVTRSKLQELYVNREIVRRQAKGEVVNEEVIQADGWKSVNRIFRGALDNDVIAVNTKDLAYYRGLKIIGDYVDEALKDGVNINELLNFLLRGKFDPTNKRHVALVMSLG
jgi:hypothetical protein